MLPIIDMISATKYGHCWSRIYPGSEANGVESPKITGVLSTRYFGYCEPERLGVICHRITGNGVPFISALSGGAGRVSGKNCWIS